MTYQFGPEKSEKYIKALIGLETFIVFIQLIVKIKINIYTYHLEQHVHNHTVVLGHFFAAFLIGSVYLITWTNFDKLKHAEKNMKVDIKSDFFSIKFLVIVNIIFTFYFMYENWTISYKIKPRPTFYYFPALFYIASGYLILNSSIQLMMSEEQRHFTLGNCL